MQAPTQNKSIGTKDRFYRK